MLGKELIKQILDKGAVDMEIRIVSEDEFGNDIYYSPADCAPEADEDDNEFFVMQTETAM